MKLASTCRSIDQSALALRALSGLVFRRDLGFRRRASFSLNRSIDGLYSSSVMSPASTRRWMRSSGAIRLRASLARSIWTDIGTSCSKLSNGSMRSVLIRLHQPRTEYTGQVADAQLDVGVLVDPAERPEALGGGYEHGSAGVYWLAVIFEGPVGKLKDRAIIILGLVAVPRDGPA